MRFRRKFCHALLVVVCDPVSILSIHNRNPDRLVTVKDIHDSRGTNKL